MRAIEQLQEEYIEAFGESLVVNMLPEKDRTRVREVLEECLRQGKPYSGYIDEDPAPGTTIE